MFRKKRWNIFLLFFFWYSDIEQKLVGFCQKEIRRICKNCLLRVHTNILLKNRFYGKFFFFVIWATLVRAFGQQFTEKLSKTFSTCSDNILWKQIFSNLSCFWCIILLWAQIFWDLAEIFPQSDKVFYGSRRRLWWKTFFDKFSFFWILVETFSDFRQKFLRKVVKTVFYVFMKHFDEKNSLIFLFLVHIWTLSENFLTFD